MVDGQMGNSDKANTGKYELQNLGAGTGCSLDNFLNFSTCLKFFIKKLEKNKKNKKLEKSHCRGRHHLFQLIVFYVHLKLKSNNNSK